MALIKSFHELTDALDEAIDESIIKQVCDQFAEQVELEYYLFAVCSVTSLSAPQIHSFSNYPEDWFKSYFEESMQKHDPVVKYCFEHTTPIRWDQLIEMDEYVDANGAQIMQRAAEVGLVNGFSIPVKAHTGEVAIFSLATEHQENVQSRMLEALPYSQLFSAKLFEAHTRLSHKEDESKGFNLTSREIECLFWACEGKTTWEISKIVDVSERTIIFHLGSATKKLGAVNRQHAVAKAIMCGLIKPTP